MTLHLQVDHFLHGYRNPKSSDQLFSHFIPLSLGGLINEQSKGGCFCSWSFCLKIMGVTKWWGRWGEMSEVVGVEGPLAMKELHVPGPARLLSKAFLLKDCNNLNGKALSSLIWIFCAIKNLAFCPPWMWGEKKKLFIVHSSLLHLWNLLCLFFFKLNRPQSVLINSSTPAALLDRQSNEYCNKNLV